MRRIVYGAAVVMFFMAAGVVGAQDKPNTKAAEALLKTSGALQGTEKHSSAAQAKMWVEKADKYIKDHGLKAAIAEFNKPTGSFVKDDLYISVIDFDCVMVAFPRNHKMIGVSQTKLTDPEGKFFIKDMAALAKTKGFGWVDYKYPHPHTKVIGQKTTYVKRIADTNMFLACGVNK